MKHLVKHGDRWVVVQETGEFQPLEAVLAPQAASPSVSESEIEWPDDDDEVVWPEE